MEETDYQSAARTPRTNNMNKEKLYAYVKFAWPTIYRIINDGLYFLINVIKSIVRIAIDEIKGKS